MNETEYQIVNDQKGFTIYDLNVQKWGEFSNQEINFNSIKFSDFSKEKTFKLIEEVYRSTFINQLIQDFLNDRNQLKNYFKDINIQI